MTSYNPEASQRALMTVRNLSQGQHQALDVRSPPGAVNYTESTASDSFKNQAGTTVMVSQGHAQLNVEGIQVKTEYYHAKADSRKTIFSELAREFMTAERPDGSRALPSTAPILPASAPGKQSSQNRAAQDGKVSKAITSGERGLVSQKIQAPQNGSVEAERVGRTGEASRHVREEHIEHANVKAGNLSVGVVRHETVVEEDRLVVGQESELTDDGNLMLRQYVCAERIFYRRVVEFMYIAAINEPEVPEEPTKKEKCIDCCFQAYECKYIKKLCCKNRREDEAPKVSGVSKIRNLEPILRRGRSKGWVIHTEMIFPLVKASLRNIWVTAELIAVLLALILSITSFTLGKNSIFNVLHFGLSTGGSILAIIDAVILLYGCRLCKQCRVCSHKVEQTLDAEEQGSEGDLLIDKTEASCKGTCKECLKATRNLFDLIRMILSELIFYPLLITNLFEMIIGETYCFHNVKDGISFFLFAISLASQLFFVYIVRIAILIVANSHSQKKRLPKDIHDKDPHNNTRLPKDRKKFDRSNSKAALWFQVYFVLHICAQMMAQILMIAAIAGVIHEENSHFFDGGPGRNESFVFCPRVTNTSDIVNSKRPMDKDESIHISNYLWYMLVSGYVLPIFGILTFFVVTYFWVQEFPIGICIDVLSVLQAPGVDGLLDSAKAKQSGEKMSKISKFVNLAEMKDKFKKLRSTASFEKFSYAFQSPQMVLISMIYAGLQLAFVVCAYNSVNNYYWRAFFVLAAIVGYIANLYVFTVAVFWSVVIMAILFMIASFFSVIIFCCIIAVCVSSTNNDNRYRS